MNNDLSPEKASSASQFTVISVYDDSESSAESQKMFVSALELFNKLPERSTRSISWAQVDIKKYPEYLPARENGTLYNTPSFFVKANGLSKYIEIDRKKFDKFELAVKKLVEEIAYFTRDPITPITCDKIQKFKQQDVILAFVFFGSDTESVEAQIS